MMMIVDIFDIIQQARDTGIHLKGLVLILVLILVVMDQESKSSRGPQNKRNEGRKMRRTHVYLSSSYDSPAP